LQALPVKGSAAAVERGREKKKKKKMRPRLVAGPSGNENGVGLPAHAHGWVDVFRWE
jgi:hypothetical protein